MKVTIIHPGTQYSHQLVGQLSRLDLLYRFVTGLAFVPDDPLIRLLSTHWRRKLANRILQFDLLPEKLVRIPTPELVALAKLRLGFSMEPTLQRRNQVFQKAVRNELIDRSEAIIGFDTSSWIVAERAHSLGIPFYLDQSIGHPAKKVEVFAGLRSRYPKWAEDVVDKDSKYRQREVLEHKLSSKVVVASSFTRNSLIQNGVPAEKIVINPYGVGPGFFQAKKRSRAPGEKLRLLYLGFLGARKGLPFLIEVWNQHELHRYAEVWLAGPASPYAVEAVKQTPGMIYREKLPHREIPELIGACDVLLFPSFYEGFGQVILEAMASGLPVITTEATAGPDIIEHKSDGWLFSAGDPQGLVEAVMAYVQDHSLAGRMGERAREKAKSFSWESYGDRWATILRG
jgi:glycosyltransferase involved in cell wall biosynthesis